MTEQHINTAGLSIIKRFERLMLQAYMPTPNDVPTLGWGHTNGVKMGDTCDAAQADQWLMAEDIPDAEFVVGNAVTVDLNANQFSALVSFVFNIGPGVVGLKDGFVTLKNGRPSSMLTFINDGNFNLAAGEFHKWNHQGGVELAGLTRRRQSEEELFRRPVKPLGQSKTIQAGTIAVPSAAVGLLDQFDSVRDALYTLTPYWKYAAVGIAILSVLSAGYMVWRRIHDNVQGAH